MRPIQDLVDEMFEYYFKCNSTLENEGTVYSVYTVQCMPDEELSVLSSIIRRREDATMQCPKIIRTNTTYLGVSQNSESKMEMFPYNFTSNNIWCM